MYPRRPFDTAGYTQRVQRDSQRACWICALAEGKPTVPHHLVYQDAHAIAFLNRYPTLYGYILVAPRAHREQVTGDFALEEYLALHRVIYRVAEAVRQEVPTERLYILSLGSQQGNRHVHWHLAPLPPGVPYEEQQLAALSLERGVLAIPKDDQADLAQRLAARLANSSDYI